MKPTPLPTLMILFAVLLVSCTAPANTQPTAISPTHTPTSIPPTLPPTPVPPAATPTAVEAAPQEDTIQPGEAIGGMTIRLAADESDVATNIWDYCDPVVEAQQGILRRECDVPAFPGLFIGNGVGVTPSANANAELDKYWSELHWRLYIDDQLIDLESFGPVDVWGGTFRLWNVVIEQPSLGKHSLRYLVSSDPGLLGASDVTWNFTVKELSAFPELNVVLPPQPTPLPLPSQAVRRGAGGLPWWNERVFYEVFVRSFKDSDGDGIGDLQGLISKLDYLNDGNPATDSDLGVTGLWLMPVADSPSYHGYDVVDYKKIEPDYGTNEDFKQLMTEAHERGMVIIVDLVMNHTSNQHPWFIESQKPGSPYESWYIWDDSPIPFPSPWGSQVWHPLGGRYYYGLFWEGMPDLNYRNGDVTLAMREAIQFWLLEMGVDGFRLDAVRHLVEEGAVQENTPETHAWLEDFYRYVHSLSPDALTVGEVWDDSAEVVKYVGDELDTLFEFDLAQAMLDSVKSGSSQKLLDVQGRVLDMYPPGQYAAFLTNHDQNRVMNQLLKNIPQAKAAATLLLTNPGVPFIYYGEEIGMRGVKPDERIRTPMQWDGSANAGFTGGTPWEALNNDIATVNVEALSADPQSLFSHYRRLVHLRQAHPALTSGAMALVESSSPQVYAFLRYDQGETLLVMVNLSEEPVSDYRLTLPEGPLSGSPAAALLLGEGQPAAPTPNAAGGFEAYTPLPELAPLGSYVIEMGGENH